MRAIKIWSQIVTNPYEGFVTGILQPPEKKPLEKSS
jgi:hypothetical protein